MRGVAGGYGGFLIDCWSGSQSTSYFRSGAIQDFLPFMSESSFALLVCVVLVHDTPVELPGACVDQDPQGA